MTQAPRSSAYFSCQSISMSARTFVKNAPVLRRILTRLAKPLLQLREKSIIKNSARQQGISINFYPEHIDFRRADQLIRISRQHLVYSRDIINSFDYYFSAVEPLYYSELRLVDYSTPRYHDVIGYERHPVYFTSFSEPIVTTKQYMEFSGLRPGAVAIDLGAYSGLTSILFKDAVGPTGTVVAVDADNRNIVAIRKNIASYNRATNETIELLYGAVWKHDRGLDFTTEGNMGSSASEIIGIDRGKTTPVPSYKLSDISRKFSLDRVDFIKCDVEGAEVFLFEDASFFDSFKPRIIIETHIVDGIETTEKCVSDLQKYGYECKRIYQTGVTLPLIECYPPQRRASPAGRS